MKIHDNGTTNPLIEISYEEFHEWLRSKVNETVYKDRGMSAVQFRFVDSRGTETLICNLPEEIVVMVPRC